MTDRFHILVVGENKRFLSTTINYLGKLGHFVDGALTAEDVFMKCDKNITDLVIMRDDLSDDTKDLIKDVLSIKHPLLVVISFTGPDSDLNHLIDKVMT